MNELELNGYKTQSPNSNSEDSEDDNQDSERLYLEPVKSLIDQDLIKKFDKMGNPYINLSMKRFVS
jgi:hypothetical protein